MNKINVPLLDLRAQYKSIKGEVERTILRIAESQMLVLGPEVEKLEKTLADYCGVKFAVGVSSGTDALLMALMAIDIRPGDEVIMPTYSFFATAGVVARLNAKPIFVDSDPKSFNIDTNLISKAISRKTKAIMPVHLYGQCADMDEILRIAAERGIPVIEDAAQAIGAQYANGKKAGSMGKMGCFSFYPTKNLGGFGDSGLVITDDESIYLKLKQMRNHGMEPKYHHKFVGGNFRIDALQAGVLNVKFKLLEHWHKSRRDNAELYNSLFIAEGLASGNQIDASNANISSDKNIIFDNDNHILLPKAVWKDSGHENYHIYNQYVIRVRQRDELRKFLADNNIASEIYYPVPFHRQECFANLNCVDSDFPVANAFAGDSLALPIYPELSNEQIEYVVIKIKEFIKAVN